VSELSLDSPFFSTCTGDAVLTLTEEPEHKGVWSVAEVLMGENFLDGFITVQNNGEFSADSQAENAAEMSAEFGEGFAEIEHVQEGQVAEKWNSDGAGRKILISVNECFSQDSCDDGEQTTQKVKC